MTKNIWCP